MLPEEIRARPRVLITDAGERSMLATCRGLRASGYAVSAAAFRPLAATHWSRCCSERLRVTDPRLDAAGFIADLRGELERRPCSVLVPGSDFSLLAVSRARDELEGLTRLGLRPHAVVERSFNREVLATAAASAGLSPAPAVRCGDAREAIAAAKELGFPVLLKSVSTVQDWGNAVRAGPDTRRIDTEQELRSELGAYRDSFLVQRVEVGRTLSFGGVIADGRLLGVAISAYQRTWPPTAGNVSFSATIDPPPGLEQAITTLLCHVGWEGIFEIELMQKADGHLVPIDFNPRPYGSMALAVASGANLPAIWCDWVLDRSPRPVRARSGTRYRWEDADLRHLLWQARRGHYLAAARTLRPWPDVVHPHFRASDPLPMLARVLSLVSRKVQAILLVIILASAVLFVVCLFAWLNMRRDQNASLQSRQHREEHGESRT